MICVLVYNDLFSWKAATEQIGLLICSVFFVIGFLFTLCVLYLVSFALGRRPEKNTNKDELIFPPWLLLVFCFFWQLPYGLSILPDIPLLKKLAEQYPTYTFLKFDFRTELKVILNMMAIAPFLCILTWVLCAKEEDLKPNEELVRRPRVLSLALICVGALVTSFFIPKYRLAMWIVLLPLTLIFFSLWCFWLKKITRGKEKTEQEKENEAEELKKNEKPRRRPCNCAATCSARSPIRWAGCTGAA